jgi:two-component system, chemotaxis family, chemotaxis protein CheY
MGMPLKAPANVQEEAPALDLPPVASPIQEASIQAVTEPVVSQQPAAQRQHRTCLIVDDSRVVRGVSRSIVEGLGYLVLEAENGEEALARCRANMPDLILLDWDMPIMTGIQFISQLRALDTQKRPKAVFCTSRSDSTDIYKGIEAGADEYVTKPFTEVSLKAKLERIGAL